MANDYEPGQNGTTPDGPTGISINQPDPDRQTQGLGPALHIDQAQALERENPLPLVSDGIHELYEEPLSTRDRHLGLMALGQRHESWY